jgi:hypothetical protein
VHSEPPRAEQTAALPPGTEPPDPGALGLSFLVGGPALVLGCTTLVLMASNTSVASFWHRFQEGGTGMWVLFFASWVGVAVTLTVSVMALMNKRASVWPLLVVPALAGLGGLGFEHRSVQRALEVLEGPGIDGMQRLRIFAEASAEAQNPRALGLLCAGLLLAIATFSVTGLALHLRGSRGPAAINLRALGAGLVCTFSCLAYAFGGAPEPLALVVVALGCATVALSSAFLGAASSDDAHGEHHVGRDLLQVAALAVSAQLCIVGVWQALARDKAFSAIGGESVPDELAAPRLAEALRLADWSQSTLALLPLVVALVALGPALIRAPRLPWQGASAFAVSLAALGLAQLATRNQVEHCSAYYQQVIPSDLRLATTHSGKPQRYGMGARTALWVGKDSILLRSFQNEESRLGSISELVAEGCKSRLDGVAGAGRTEFILDESLRARDLECLLIASLKLAPTEDDHWNNRPDDDLPELYWTLRFAQPELPPPYADLVLRTVQLAMGVASSRSVLHLELHETHWQLLEFGAPSVRVAGELPARRAGLVKALQGRKQWVSVAAAADLSASVVVEAGLAVTEAKSEPRLWLSGYSGLSLPETFPTPPLHTL